MITIMRGLPGVGKSSYILLREHDYIFSADDFWGKEYNFDPKRLGEAHIDCMRRYLFRLINGQNDDKIFVDNTNIRAYELAPYIQLAQIYKFDYKVVTLWCDPIVAWCRNIHKVPLKVILGMFEGLVNEKLPPWWNCEVTLSTRLNRGE